MRVGPLQMIMLQPTPFCNIDCTYCYLETRNDKRVMSESVLRAALMRTFTSGVLTDALDILWHAGEPLVAGIAHLRSACRLIEEYNTQNIPITKLVMTNATLVDDAWCLFFREEQFGVGVSLDGPEDIHDSQRMTRRGGGTWAQTMRGIEKLRAHGHDPSFMAVLTKQSLRDPGRLLDFFETHGFHRVAFNLEEREANWPRWSFSSATEAEEMFAAFLDEAYARHRTGRLEVRDIDELEKRRAQGARARVGVAPLRWVTIAANGDFSTFCPQLHGIRYAQGDRHVFGNVLTDAFIDVFENETFLRVHAEMMAGAEACARTCERFDLCGSVQQSCKYYENGGYASTETLTCRAKVKMVADRLDRHV